MAWIRACGGKSGYIVTYHIDTNDVITKPIKYGDDCITNAPPVSVVGLTLHGWRMDDEPSSTVVQEKLCDGDNIHLYAVLKRDITVSYNGNGNTGGSVASQTGTYYYNNGNEANPRVTLASNGYTKTDYTFADWAMGSSLGTRYLAGETVELASDTTFYAYWFETVKNIAYTGMDVGYSVEKTGEYQLEVYGAKSANYGYLGGSNGGYAKGNVLLDKGDTLYICVGGTNGYNGGGNYQVNQYTAGGCTHIAKTETNRGFLYNYDSYRDEILIVAGGAGCGNVDAWDNKYYGGAGGGATGGNGTNCHDNYGYGGNNGSHGQAFGRGGNTNGSSAGGGGWYGGTSGTWNAAGGGGCGYVGGCIVGTTSMTNGACSGNGSARITFVA